MYEPNDLDRFLALHVSRPPVLEREGSRAAVMAMVGVLLVSVTIVFLFATPWSIWSYAVIIALVASLVLLAMRVQQARGQKIEQAPRTLFQELSEVAFGQHGYVRGPNARPEDRPVPIRSMRNVLPTAAFEALNSGTRDWMRIDAAIQRSESARQMQSELEKVKKIALQELEAEVEPMYRFPEGTPQLSPKGELLLKQLNEIANHLERVHNPPMAALGQGNPLVEQTLIEVRARTAAMRELSEELPTHMDA